MPRNRDNAWKGPQCHTWSPSHKRNHGCIPTTAQHIPSHHTVPYHDVQHPEYFTLSGKSAVTWMQAALMSLNSSSTLETPRMRSSTARPSASWPRSMSELGVSGRYRPPAHCVTDALCHHVIKLGAGSCGPASWACQTATEPLSKRVSYSKVKGHRTLPNITQPVAVSRDTGPQCAIPSICQHSPRLGAHCV